MHPRPPHPFTAPGALALLLFAGFLLRGAAAAPPAGRPAAGAAAKIRVEDGGGRVLFILSAAGDGFRVEDGRGAKLGAVKVETDRVKTADAGGRPRHKIKRKDAGFKLYREPAAPGGADVETAGFDPDGTGFRIKSAAGAQLYRARPRDGKTRVECPGGREAVVKEKEDGLEVEDGGGRRLVRLKGIRSAAAAVFCAAPEYDALQKATVVAYLARIHR